MPRRGRNTSIQLLNETLAKVVIHEAKEDNLVEKPLEGGRAVKAKNKVSKPKKKDDKPINTRILLTR